MSGIVDKLAVVAYNRFLRDRLSDHPSTCAAITTDMYASINQWLETYLFLG